MPDPSPSIPPDLLRSHPVMATMASDGRIPMASDDTVGIPQDEAVSVGVPSGIPAAALPVRPIPTDVSLRTEIKDQAEVFGTLAETHRQLEGPGVAGDSWVARLMGRKGLPAADVGRGVVATVDGRYGSHVDQMVQISASILDDLRFLKNSHDLEGSTYRSLAAAVDRARLAPTDRQALLALYGEMITFVQVLRQGGAERKAGVMALLQSNFESFRQGAARTGGFDRAVSGIVANLDVPDVATLQRDRLGMASGAVSGVFDAPTYFQTQLFVLEQMARNLSRRDGLGLSVMQMSVADARAAVDRLADLRGQVADRIRQGQLRDSTRAFLTTLGYRLTDGGLLDPAGNRLSDQVVTDLAGQWASQARFMAEKSREEVFSALATHGGNLTDRQRRVVDRWVRAYERLYAEAVGDPSALPPEQPDVTEVLAEDALKQVADTENRLPPVMASDAAEAADARHQRDAAVLEAQEAFYHRLRQGVRPDSLSREERRSVERFERHGLIRHVAGQVFLVASDSDLAAFAGMVQEFRTTKSPAMRAIFDRLVMGAQRASWVAGLTESVEAPANDAVSPAGPAQLADEPVGEGRTTVGVAGNPQETVPGIHGALAAVGPDGVAAGVVVVSPTEAPEDDGREAEAREKRVERRRQRDIDQFDARAAANVEHGRGLQRENARHDAAVGRTVVRGADGKTVGYFTNAAGELLGITGVIGENPEG